MLFMYKYIYIYIDIDICLAPHCFKHPIEIELDDIGAGIQYAFDAQYMYVVLVMGMGIIWISNERI